VRKALLSVLTKEQLRDLHLATLEILERTGVRMAHQRSLKYLDKMGANVDFKNQVVRFPRNLVEGAVKKSPKKVRICARDPKKDVILGDGRPHSHPSGGHMYVIDLESGEHRLGFVRDVQMAAKLVDALIDTEFMITILEPQDVPAEVRAIVCNKEILENTEKAVFLFVDYPKQSEYNVKMCAEVVGGIDELKKRPISHGIIAPTSPLVYGEAVLENLWYYGELGLPCYFCSMVSAGTTGPVTLAGSIAIQLAEHLAGLTLLQLFSPGTQAVFAPRLSITDLKQGTFSYGSPENGLMAAAFTQLVKTYYGIPVDTGYSVSDSKVLDMQVAYDKALTMLPAVLAGVDAISGLGGLESGLTTSPAQLVIDDELFSMVRRISNGFDVDEDRLAIDLIYKVGPGRHFAGERHTLEYVKGEQFLPKLTDRRSRSKWLKMGAKNAVDRARDIARDILATHEPEPLPKDVRKRLEVIVKKAEKELVGGGI